MVAEKFVAYFRVSTQRQGTSGLGLDAQRDAARRFHEGRAWICVGEFVEIESGRKTELHRPKLKAALDLCKREGAVLVVAKIDRLARSVHFISGLMSAGVKFVAVDMPEANELTVHIMAAFAEHEAKRISQRTKDALKVAKARGVQLGRAGSKNLQQNVQLRRLQADEFAIKLQSLIEALTEKGLSQRAIVAELNSLGLLTPKGCVWTLVQLQRTINRLQVLRQLHQTS